MMTGTLEDRVPPPESKLEYTAWSPFSGKEELDEGEITVNDQFVWQRNLDTL